MRVTFLLALVAALAACTKASPESKHAKAPAGAGAGATPAMPVEVMAARSDTVIDAILASGQIAALQSIEIRPDIEGRLALILVREGSEVAKGTPLFKVDDGELKAEVARAGADRDLARQALQRTRELMGQRASSQADLERAEATARSTQAQYELLSLRLFRTTVRAPFGGVVGQRFVSLGDYVTTDTRLAALQTVHPQRAVFQVPERYADRLKLGQKVVFRVASLPGQEFAGIVDFVDPVVQLPGRTIMVKAEVANRKRELQAGMFIDVRLAIDVRPAAIVVPEDAVLPLQGASFVWVAKDGKATRRQVELGVRTPGWVEAKKGIDLGDLVVVGGQERLSEGAPVAPKSVQRAPPVRQEG